jgi:4-hydroxy-3-methylbut-2-enyl diphosphate reductase
VGSRLLVLVPLRVEAAALPRRAGWTVLRSRMGPEAARIAAARGLAVEAPAVVIVGLCAGVAPELQAGDVVCATELRTESGELRRVHASAQLTETLRRCGLRVHTGPILSVTAVTGPRERRAFRTDGILAVDMESAWLAAAAGDRPLAVLRVVVDTAERRLLDPRTIRAGLRALRSLRRAGVALACWAESEEARAYLADVNRVPQEVHA